MLEELTKVVVAQPEGIPGSIVLPAGRSVLLCRGSNREVGFCFVLFYSWGWISLGVAMRSKKNCKMHWRFIGNCTRSTAARVIYLTIVVVAIEIVCALLACMKVLCFSTAIGVKTILMTTSVSRIDWSDGKQASMPPSTLCETSMAAIGKELNDTECCTRPTFPTHLPSRKNDMQSTREVIFFQLSS